MKSVFAVELVKASPHHAVGTAFGEKNRAGQVSQIRESGVVE
ncbi:MAG: hypothetical protein WC048_18175 [Rhizobium sp.]